MKGLKFLLLFFFIGLNAQNGFKILEKEKTTIPFRFINNLILIPVYLNGVELTFLLDSGVSESILFSLENKEISFKNTETVKFTGLGENIEIEGLKSIKNQLKIGKDFEDSNHTIFIILNEEINFSDHIGIPVNGIIGYRFFKNHPIEIDYVKKKITAYSNPEKVKKRTKKFEELPISIELNKPYLLADVEMTQNKTHSKLLIDLGNSDAVWLFPSLIKDFVYNRPNIDDYLGRGFNGDIFGKRSRIHGLYLQNFFFLKPLTAMPDEYSIQHLKLAKDRKGSIGSEIFRRFTMILDYPNKKIYLRKNNFFNDPFLFNKSGLDIKHDGMQWEKDLVKVETQKKEFGSNSEIIRSEGEQFQYKFVLKPQYSVAGCRKDSPCQDAGIKKGDKIISVDDKKVSNLSLEKIMNILKEGENGKRINFEIERNQKRLNLQLILQDPIPYQEQENQ